MSRNTSRILGVLLMILIAVLTPLIGSGYADLKKAPTSSSYTEAAQRYRRAAERIPWRPDLYELAGHAYYHAQEYAQASAMYQKALARSALSSEGWMAWGDVAYLNDDPERALQIWQDGLEQQNPSAQLYLRLSSIAQEQREFIPAGEYMQRYLSVHSEDASAHYRLGLLLASSDPNQALSELANAAQLNPELDPFVQTLRTTLSQASIEDSPSERFVVTGRGLGVVGEWELAYAAFEEATKADEKNAEAWAWLGEARQQMHWAGGEAALDSALVLNPQSSTVRGLRGLYFQRTGNFREALTEFQTAAELDPNNPAWQVSLGESHAKLGDLIDALQSYQTAITLAPEDPGYWRLLAIFCAQNNVNIKDVGVPAAQKAVILAGEDATSFDVLGWLLTLDARYQEAERMLNRALELDPQNSSAHLHFGMLYLQRNDRISAYDHLVQARDLGSQEAQMILSQYFPQ